MTLLLTDDAMAQTVEFSGKSLYPSEADDDDYDPTYIK